MFIKYFIIIVFNSTIQSRHQTVTYKVISNLEANLIFGELANSTPLHLLAKESEQRRERINQKLIFVLIN